MKIRENSVIAFKEEYFAGKPSLTKFIVTRLKVSKQDVVGVHAKHYKEVCKALKLVQSKITSKPTKYNGVFLAVVQEPKVNPKAAEIRAKKQIMRDRYIQVSGGPNERRAKQVTEMIHKQEAYIGELQVTLVKHLRELQERIREQQMFSSGSKELMESKGREFDKLVEHPDIESIVLGESEIEVLTGPIEVAHGQKVYDIGKFKISLPYTPRSFVVRMINLTRKIRTTCHPHVSRDGNPCLGNIAECLPNMISDRQFAAAIAVCIQYLKSIHEGGHLSRITEWPLKKAKEEEKDGKK